MLFLPNLSYYRPGNGTKPSWMTMVGVANVWVWVKMGALLCMVPYDAIPKICETRHLWNFDIFQVKVFKWSKGKERRQLSEMGTLKEHDRPLQPTTLLKVNLQCFKVASYCHIWGGENCYLFIRLNYLHLSLSEITLVIKKKHNLGERDSSRKIRLWFKDNVDNFSFGKRRVLKNWCYHLLAMTLWGIEEHLKSIRRLCVSFSSVREGCKTPVKWT